MRLFGITGGIGMGKSTAGNLLLGQGYSVIDTDTIAHHLVEPGQPALEEIKEKFGHGVISSTGTLQRAELAKIVFADSSARQKLEAILHPRIREVWQGKVQSWRSQNRTVGFVIIPLLFETNATNLFDAVICLACSPASQMKRLKSRGWSESQTQERIAAQWSIEKKTTASDYLVWTETNIEVHAAQLKRILFTAL